MEYEPVTIALPGWVGQFLAEQDSVFDTVEERMLLVIELARLNIEHKTGGPFAAGVFEEESGELVSVGVNLVPNINCSIAHGEMVAIAFAQKRLESFDLYADGVGRQLVTSTEPCAMCLGAIPWSGLRSVVCGAADSDAREIGFDEGAKPADWVGQLGKRNIEVTQNICRQEAASVLVSYMENGGEIYNP